ncbi:MAG TPA: TetR/AcrR family transcriptional regulator C-terminal domain-containing protein [Myxococcaceae bacterium]|nr:TetR/AcrR family transcriptional regulator C-terminal domain-containing protein [Myxococcaceae bacterium]
MTRERVLRTAVRLADKGGLESLSMRKLAQSLGVEAMSLYHHVANKDALLDGIADLVVEQFALPAIGGDWKEQMRKRAHSAHEVFLRHPWATMLVGSRRNVGPAMMRYVNATLGCLREAGFSYALADRAWNALDSHIYGFTLQQLNFPLDRSEYASAARGFLPMLPAEQYPYMRELTQLVADGAHQGVHDFAFSLELILEGLERLRTKG